jgi:hypothetical protein
VEGAGALLDRASALVLVAYKAHEHRRRALGQLRQFGLHIGVESSAADTLSLTRASNVFVIASCPSSFSARDCGEANKIGVLPAGFLHHNRTKSAGA